MFYMRNSEEIGKLKSLYPAGTRIVLNHMGYDPRPIESGTKGTVIGVDDIGTIHVQWDNGRMLGVIPGTDSFSIA